MKRPPCDAPGCLYHAELGARHCNHHRALYAKRTSFGRGGGVTSAAVAQVSEPLPAVEKQRLSEVPAWKQAEERLRTAGPVLVSGIATSSPTTSPVLVEVEAKAEEEMPRPKLSSPRCPVCREPMMECKCGDVELAPPREDDLEEDEDQVEPERQPPPSASVIAERAAAVEASRAERGFTPPVEIEVKPRTPARQTYKAKPNGMWCQDCGNHIDDHEGEGTDWEQWLCPKPGQQPAPAPKPPPKPLPKEPEKPMRKNTTGKTCTAPGGCLRTTRNQSAELCKAHEDQKRYDEKTKGTWSPRPVSQVLQKRPGSSVEAKAPAVTNGLATLKKKAGINTGKSLVSLKQRTTRQPELPAMPEPEDLGDFNPRSLSTPQLKACVKEFERRAAEMFRDMRELGLKIPGVAMDAPPN